jgi:hypothetical protein
MSAQNVMIECEFLGVSIRLDGGKLKLNGSSQSVNVAADLVRPHKAELIAYLSGLDQFKFEEVKADIANGHPATDIHRVNNMAWQFMHEDGLSFQDAIIKAAEIVVNCEAAKCEKSYEDVMKLWERITANVHSNT